MSFISVISGLRRGRGAQTIVTMPGLEAYGGEHECADYHGNAVGCPTNGDDTHIFGVSIGSIAFDTSADYFLVSVLIHGPYLDTYGTCHVPANPTDYPCGGPGDPAVYDATLTGSYLRATSDHGDEANVYEESIPATFSFNSDLLGVAPEWPRDIPHVGRNVGLDAFLVNPADTWPVPDTFGNTFGQCLFTLAQLPSTLGMTIDHHNGEQVHAGSWRVGVTPYYLTESGGGGTLRSSCIIGQA